mmetsp:Transcript_40667/g.77625  ORF Transcript_40667/g.77625 Transcript_40667/m.77625 type:complete len:119 (+) Transcript_40667:751-1107(+)
MEQPWTTWGIPQAPNTGAALEHRGLSRADSLAGVVRNLALKTNNTILVVRIVEALVQVSQDGNTSGNSRVVVALSNLTAFGNGILCTEQLGCGTTGGAIETEDAAKKSGGCSFKHEFQ